uniref:hypothetical protein n=1 Tax=Neisseria gonorrhoeae TaxID=485 RepID=UPI0027D96540
MEIEEETPVFEEGGRDTLLHALQTDIQNLKMPSENVGSVNTGAVSKSASTLPTSKRLSSKSDTHSNA